jgi:hypothetical protein
MQERIESIARFAKMATIEERNALARVHAPNGARTPKGCRLTRAASFPGDSRLPKENLRRWRWLARSLDRLH